MRDQASTSEREGGVVVEGDSITGSQDVMIVNVPTIMTQHNDHRNEWSIECHDLLLT